MGVTFAVFAVLRYAPSNENGLRLVKKNIGAVSSKVYVLSMVKNQFTAIINDATADCPSLQTISHNLSQQLGENEQTIACAMLTSYSDLIEVTKQNARNYASNTALSEYNTYIALSTQMELRGTRKETL